MLKYRIYTEKMWLYFNGIIHPKMNTQGVTLKALFRAVSMNGN